MSGLLKHFEFMSSTAAEGLGLVVADSAQNAALLRQAENEPNKLVEFPKRPDLTALSETIPLFYIGQNNRGFWVAREADGRCGGVFLLRRSAVRFTQQKSAPAGCATMFLDERRELDVVNEGNRIVEPLTAVIDLATRRAPKFTAFVAMAIARWRRFDTQIWRFCASELKDRAAPELVRGRYTPSSKNDGDTSFPDAP
jgi:hypothetical protein